MDTFNPNPVTPRERADRLRGRIETMFTMRHRFTPALTKAEIAKIAPEYRALVASGVYEEA